MSMYRNVLGAGFFAKKASQVQQRRYAILEGFKTFAGAPEDVLQLLEHPGALSESFSGDLVRFILCTCEGEKALRDKGNRTLWSAIVKAGDDRWDKREQDAGTELGTNRCGSCSWST